MNRRFAKLIPCALVVALCCALAGKPTSAQSPGESASDRKGNENGHAEPTAARAEVSFAGHFARQTVKLKDSVDFWINVDNFSVADAGPVEIVNIFAPGFRKQTALQFADTNCANGTVLADKVAPGTSAMLSGTLTAEYAEDLQNDYVEVCWRQGKHVSQKLVQLGQAETLRSWVYRFSWLRGKPEVTIPAALTLLTLLAAWWTRSRQERTQTWNTMQLESQKASMHYFMPSASMIAASVAYLRAHREKDKSAKPLTLEKSFFYMMMFQWIHKQTFQKVGAYHFQSRMGEDILQILFGQHKKFFALYDDAHELLMDRVLSLMSKDTTLDTFVEMVKVRALDVGAAWKLFQKWADTDRCGEDLLVLEAYKTILVYEVNRPHLNWYGTLEPLMIAPEVHNAVMSAVGTSDPDLYYRAKRYLLFNKFAKADNWRLKLGYCLGKTWAMAGRGFLPKAEETTKVGN